MKNTFLNPGTTTVKGTLHLFWKCSDWECVQKESWEARAVGEETKERVNKRERILESEERMLILLSFIFPSRTGQTTPSSPGGLAIYTPANSKSAIYHFSDDSLFCQKRIHACNGRCWDWSNWVRPLQCPK